jgi:hypothetical protein
MRSLPRPPTLALKAFVSSGLYVEEGGRHKCGAALASHIAFCVCGLYDALHRFAKIKQRLLNA